MYDTETNSSHTNKTVFYAYNNDNSGEMHKYVRGSLNLTYLVRVRYETQLQIMTENFIKPLKYNILKALAKQKRITYPPKGFPRADETFPHSMSISYEL